MSMSSFWKRHSFWIYLFVLMVSCSVPVLAAESCSHHKPDAWEVFDDKDMREHVGVGCKYHEKLQCSETWGTSGCSKTHSTTCMCVDEIPKKSELDSR